MADIYELLSEREWHLVFGTEKPKINPKTR